ncbi:MAG: UDP-N-acetylglucosamine 2-epimerase (non-hydrolyzing) [Planctomycetota bacterium]
MKTVLTLFGTRPELIKLAPVMSALDADGEIASLQVCSAQHRELLTPFLELFGTRVDAELDVMRPGQPLNLTAARVLERLDPVLEAHRPELLVVQGDTTTTLGGALAAFHRGIPVVHVEAGLRTDDLANPFPEEMNRRLVGRIAALHCAATEANRRRLLDEGVPAERVVLTGNPVLDALGVVAERARPTEETLRLLAELEGKRILALTAHRRESQGPVLEALLRVVADFAAARDDVAVVYPVHPNPRVREAAGRALAGRARVHLIEPLGYADFLALVRAAWLVVSDSGGVQEEAPSLGTPLLVLRETTERPEAIEAGVARLVGLDPARLAAELEAAEEPAGWTASIGSRPNPFGDGRSAPRILAAIRRELGLAAEADHAS